MWYFCPNPSEFNFGGKFFRFCTSAGTALVLQNPSIAIPTDKTILSTRLTFSSCVSDQERDLWASVLSRISRRIWNITSESSRRRNGWKAAVSVGGTGGGKAENEKLFLCVEQWKTKSLNKVSFQPMEINSYLGLDLTVSSFFVGYLQTERIHEMLETKPHYMS